MGFFAGILTGIIMFHLYKNGHLTKILKVGKKLYNKVLYK